MATDEEEMECLSVTFENSLDLEERLENNIHLNAKCIGERLGDVLEVENPLESGFRGFLRLKVDFDASKPLITQLKISCPKEGHRNYMNPVPPLPSGGYRFPMELRTAPLSKASLFLFLSLKTFFGLPTKDWEAPTNDATNQKKDNHRGAGTSDVVIRDKLAFNTKDNQSAIIRDIEQTGPFVVSPPAVNDISLSENWYDPHRFPYWALKNTKRLLLGSDDIWANPTQLSLKDYSSHGELDLALTEPTASSTTKGYPAQSHPTYSRTKRAISTMSVTTMGCWGDFNELLHIHEKLGGPVRPIRQILKFQEAINNCNLKDLGYVGNPFT
ncbi:hypothetical protein D8674_033883 [Pyrus ussuriensis x Pyrus communis]|uniref:Uncharacterized protein n=1 Tax=Pyrus ussuriensis x Pyrus communis TaxID=2448454 RepID=A0A5N5HNA1_9ROSA|nr:hypothetical protein D8674_033883 [Pyrus ussuriensis x Pyrus communis]